MSESPTHLKQTIKDQLIAQFQSWPLGTRLPSLRILADEMGVAYLTADGAMRELEWEGYVRRVPRKGTFLAARERTVVHDPHTGGYGLKSIVFAYPNYFSYPTWIRLHHAETFAVQRGMAIIELKLTPDSDMACVAQLLEQRDDVVGAMIIPTSGTNEERMAEAIDPLGLPIVWLAEFDDPQSTRHFCAIHTDWGRSGYIQAQQLLAAGHKQIAFVLNEPHAHERSKMTLSGIRQAMREAGLPQRNVRVLDGNTPAWSDSRKAGYTATRQLLAGGRVTGVIYESMHGVEGALLAAYELGVSVPADLSMISTGRSNDQEAFLPPPITTVDPDPQQEIARTIEYITGGKRPRGAWLTIQPKLKARSSIAPPPAPDRLGRFADAAAGDVALFDQSS